MLSFISIYFSFYAVTTIAAPEFRRQALVPSNPTDDFTYDNPRVNGASPVLSLDGSYNHKIAAAFKGDTISPVLNQGTSDPEPVKPCLASDPLCDSTNTNYELPKGISCNEKYEDCYMSGDETHIREQLHWEGCQGTEGVFSKPNPQTAEELSAGCMLCLDHFGPEYVKELIGGLRCEVAKDEVVSIRRFVNLPSLNQLNPR